MFRNPDKVTQGWELARKQRAIFIEFFGSDLIVVPGPEVASRMNGFLTWYTRRVLEEADSAGRMRLCPTQLSFRGSGVIWA